MTELAFEVQVIHPENALAMLLSPELLPAMRLVGKWLAQAHARANSEDPALCLNCDTQFHEPNRRKI
jgi:hypothetical protein